MKNLQQYSEKINIEEYVTNCNKLKQYFLFENLDNDPISMLKIQDEFQFCQIQVCFHFLTLSIG